MSRTGAIVASSERDRRPMQTTTRAVASVHLVHLLLLLVGSSPALLLAANGEQPFAIPADAIRVGARELADQQLTDHLARLLGNASSAGVRHERHHLPAPLQRLGALLLAAEQRKNRILDERPATSRFLSINRSAYFRGLLIVWLPVSFVLPTLAARGHYDGPDVEGNYFTRRQLEHGYDANAAAYKFEPHYGPLLSRLEAYFDLMRIDDVNCRWRLVCYASSRPEAFEPLSNLFRRLFDRGAKHSSKLQTYHPALKRFHSYAWADKKGAKFKSSDRCDEEYAQCPLAASSLVRPDVLEFWQNLSKRFAIQLQDE